MEQLSVSVHGSSESSVVPIEEEDERSVVGGEEHGESCELHFERLLQDLPCDGFGSSKAVFYQYQGFWYRTEFLRGLVSAQRHFEAYPSDVVLCSSPKTGTTWLKALAFAVLTRDRFDGAKNTPLLTAVPHDCVPMLELDLRKLNLRKQQPPPSGLSVFAVHAPYTSLPESVIRSKCKIVYIWRDAKDVIVSYWHFARKRIYRDKEGSFQEVFDLFCEGKSAYGPYWDHVLGYWKASLERPDRILFLKYEDLMRDGSGNLKRLADFLGRPFSDAEEKAGLVDDIVNLCSFQSLSNLEVNKRGLHREGTKWETENRIFFRKGVVGDWTNYLTPEMREKVDRIMQQKLHGSGLALVESN